MTLKRPDFPSDFLFGAATAAYQIEGAAFGGAGPCHWDTFAATGANVVGAEDGAQACDHYHCYDEDLQILAQGGFDAYRFSTSWARVLPEGRGTPNAAGLDYYDRLVDAILERGLQPFQTLYHWDLPSALADLGGWTHPDVADWFADFAQVITERLGDRVKRIATINEPWCVSVLSHLLGHHAPGLRDIRACARSMHHVMKAHGRAMTRLRQMGEFDLGIVLNFEATQPASDDPKDHAAAARQDAMANRWFIEAMTLGTYPRTALDGLEPHLPKGWQGHMDEIAQPVDWLGVNYYTRALVAHDPNQPWPHTAPVPGPLPKTQMDWEIYPQGLRDRLILLADEYVGDLPLYITENGMAWPAPAAVQANGNGIADLERWDFIKSHLAAVRQSMVEGANVKGFFYWSLLDNYEWAFGYEKRFGLIHVDFDTQIRTPKPSFHQFSQWLQSRQ